MTAQTGLMGLTGTDGNDGDQGDTGNQGEQGESGESADAASLDFSTLASYFEGVSGVQVVPNYNTQTISISLTPDS